MQRLPSNPKSVQNQRQNTQKLQTSTVKSLVKTLNTKNNTQQTLKPNNLHILQSSLNSLARIKIIPQLLQVTVKGQISSRSDVQNLKREEVDSITQINIGIWKQKLTDDLLYQITSSLQNMQNIKQIHLTLTDNKISNQGTQQMLECVSKLQNVEYFSLTLTGNPIDNNVCQHFEKYLPMFYNLKHLTIYMRNSKIVDCDKICKGLVNLSQLEKLSLYMQENQVNDITLQQLVSQLQKQSTLKFLLVDFQSNKIKSINYFLMNLQNLKTLLSLDANFKGNLIQFDKASLEQLKKLQTELFYLESCKIVLNENQEINFPKALRVAKIVTIIQIIAYQKYLTRCQQWSPKKIFWDLFIE
ncbi:hypothetical protein TTHERM_00628590 (macronuclear) [Tetrahymena thermophila SB210]|uniref:Kinase domain protein n=1 Tax=Tetrahymena thermophila (strain SB210) TaxID=312017 RepID=Q23RT9_TETTS|nr:hypothetical protein TTHERM_00628590 [Tetrahymena thermophila SB210]EAR99300.2 hypothetical protein TTHERM_00628590 [Tetrahymena thermophila SB210]|eukprot:XP_001019545.2 hypothetical protein TTHERM_00628590 [Tetrahymena thermophila SB210]